MDKINSIIIEDEYPARTRLTKLLGAHDSLSIIGAAETGHKAIKMIESGKPDLIFLDIQLPDMSGFEILQSISYQPLVIFTTAYEKYALDAFKTMAVDYLLKPIDEDKLGKSINKISQLAMNTSIGRLDAEQVQSLISIKENQQSRSTLAVHQGSKIVLINLADITHIKAEDKYTMIYLADGRSLLHTKSLANLSQSLPTNFIRVHRSTIINTTKIINIKRFIKGKYLITVNNPSKAILRTSATYNVGFKEKLGL